MENKQVKEKTKDEDIKKNKEGKSSDVPLSEKEIQAKIDHKQKVQQDWEHKVLDIARVTRVTAGGKRFSFRAVVAAGNKSGKVGVGIGKSWDLQRAVEKGINKAKKNFINIVTKDSTIPHPVLKKFNSAKVFLKPAASGSGVRAGGPIRVIAKLGGIQDISAKIVSRTNNKINIARATIEALKELKINS